MPEWASVQACTTRDSEWHAIKQGGVCGNATAMASVTSCLVAHGARGTDAASGYQLGNRLIPQFDVGVTKGGQIFAGMSLLVYYMILYFLYFATIVSGSQIPYDALGQELTDDYDERACRRRDLSHRGVAVDRHREVLR